jgi:hypothetical protein
MPLFFPHSRDGASLKRDPKGQDFAALEDARGEALRVAKQGLAEHLNGGGKLSVAMMRSIEIADQNEMVLSVVTYAEAAEADDHQT